MAEQHDPPRSILVVDDNETNLLLITKILQMEGYHVTTAENGEAALICAGEAHPDMAVLDMFMPHMDGFELCRRLRKVPGCAQIPIVILTASSGEEIRREAMAAGANVVLGKPFDVDALEQQVHLLLGDTP